MTSCTLCDLPTPNPPVRDEGVEGEFCCQGCLEVYRTLGDVEVKGTESNDISTDSDKGAQDFPEETETAFLAVDGMHCATCELFIEDTVKGKEGIVDAEASYASDMVKIIYNPKTISRDSLPGIIDGLGYKSREIHDESQDSDKGTILRLIIGGHLGMMVMLWYVIFLYPIYFDLGSNPSWTALDSDPSGISSLINVWILTSIVLFYTGFPILRGAYVSLRSGRPNMDFLIALAAVNAYVYSTVVMFFGGGEVYFDITVVIVLVVTLGNYYEKRIKSKATGLLTRLTEEQMNEARLRTSDGTQVVSLDEVKPGDEIVVKPGERIPIDGTVKEGSAAVDESLVTGESVPVRKGAGDKVVGGTIVTDGPLVIEVSSDATSTLDRIVTVLWEIQSSRSGAQRLADKLAAVFVPLVVLIALLTFGWRLITGGSFSAAFLTGLAVLIVSCPCALGLATPLAVASGVRSALSRGIVVTDASVFESTTDIDVIAFDKTGTLTTGEMRVLSYDDENALQRAAAVEQFSNHPIADAITSRAPPTDIPVREFEQYPGRGVSAVVDDELVIVGHPDLFDERGWEVPQELLEKTESARVSGNVPALVGWNGRAESVIVVGDRPRDEWEAIVSDLASQDTKIAVITGDDESAVGGFREHPSIDYVFAGVPPEAKAEIIERLQTEGKTAMVGDGSNDAPALATADLGIAFGTATALATDAADVVITTDDLATLPTVFDITGATKRRIRQNLGWAFLYNTIAIPVAVAGYLNPLIAAVAMGTSSLLVVGNSSRSLVRTEEKEHQGKGVKASDPKKDIELSTSTN
ncbi:MAG: cation-translocating P-type ATPase [Halobacteria archaeon]|nr:cation-translocating P-type ATPase [Halobacteria archaeon]